MPLSTKTTPTLQALTVTLDYSNSLVVRHYGNMDMRLALQATTPSIGLLQKENEPQVRRAIRNLFIGTSMYFDSTLSKNKADAITEELLAKYEYRSLRLEDILAICIELKESDIYKLTPARIIRQIENYNKRRLVEAANISMKKSEDEKAMLGDSNIDERIHKSVQMLEKSNEIVVQKRLYAKRFKTMDSPNKYKPKWKK